jgi:hypothetical protein
MYSFVQKLINEMSQDLANKLISVISSLDSEQSTTHSLFATLIQT